MGVSVAGCFFITRHFEGRWDGCLSGWKLMFGKEKRLSRSELLELTVRLSEENDRLRTENDGLRARLDEKVIQLSEAGSIAEASLRLSGVFEAAQNAADIYLMSLKSRNPNAARKGVQVPDVLNVENNSLRTHESEDAGKVVSVDEKSGPRHASWR